MLSVSLLLMAVSLFSSSVFLYDIVYKFERRQALMNEMKRRSAFSFALPIMIPMGVSFFFIGLGFGLYATSQGFPWWTAPVLAATIFAGSMEFVR